MLPTFLIIGAQKSGTTSLFEYLRTHPQVFVAPAKEINFFVAEAGKWSRGLRWYEEHFEGARGAPAVGEASPSYSGFPCYAGVPARIASVLPDVRLIYVMRHPIERMQSAYLHALSEGVERRPIREALLHDTRYIDWSRYSMQIELYAEHFDRSQLLPLTTEMLRDRPAETVAKVFDFLGVDPAWIPPDLGARHNSGSERHRAPRAGWRMLGATMIRHPLVARAFPPQALRLFHLALVTRKIRPHELALDDDLRSRLTTMLRPEVERTAGWMGPDFDGWGLLDGSQRTEPGCERGRRIPNTFNQQSAVTGRPRLRRPRPTRLDRDLTVAPLSDHGPHPEALTTPEADDAAALT